MASELRVNTLKDASGNNSVGMEYVANGTGMSWWHVKLYTPAIGDSFNVSSLTDGGTGDARLNLSAALSNSIRFHNSFYGSGVNSRVTSFNATNQTTTVVAMLMHTLAAALQDEDGKGQVTGDLA